MKKIMIAMMSLMLSMPIMAQYGRPRTTHYHFGNTLPHHSYHHSMTDVYYGMRIGANFSTLSSEDPSLDGGSVRSGLNVGVVAGFQVVSDAPVYFETGLSYVQKGGKGNDYGSEFTYNLDYLEVPLVLKYDYHADRLTSIQPFVGGYVAAGVGGQIKDFGNRNAYSSFDEDGFKRFDAGIKLGCGLQYDHLYVELGYDCGLSNISRDYFDTSSTGSLYATIGVNF